MNRIEDLTIQSEEYWYDCEHHVLQLLIHGKQSPVKVILPRSDAKLRRLLTEALLKWASTNTLY